MADGRSGGRWSRRRFLRAAAGVAAAAGAYAAAGCDDRAPARGPTTTAGDVPTPSPVRSRGGILRTYNFDATSYDTLDPHLTQMGPVVNMHSAVFSKLLRYEDEVAGTIVPDLAEGMPEQPDELTYIFRLRGNVRFHDTERARAAFPAVAGRELTADDVKYSIERQLNRNSPQRQRFFRADQLGVVERVDVRGPRTVELRLKTPAAPFLSFVAGRHAFVLPREVVDAQDEIATDGAMIGTGPFVLEAFESARGVRLRRNPAWFAADDDSGGAGARRPFIDGYDAYYSPQEDVFQRAAFERSLVDTTGFEETAALEHAHRTNLDDIVLDERDAGGFVASRLLLDRAPFRDDRARRAIHLAIHRHGLAALLYPPFDERPSARMTGPVAPTMTGVALDEAELLKRPGYRSDPAGRAEDIAEAKRLWSAALGDAPAPELRIIFHGVPAMIAEKAVAAVERQLRETLGVRVVPLIDASGFALAASALMKNVEGATEGVALFTFGLEDGGVDLDDWLYGHFHSGAPLNTYRLQDSTLDTMLEAQRVEFDADERRAQGIAIQEYLLGKVNARIEYFAPVSRRLTWGYVRNHHHALWNGSDFKLADTWLDAEHPAWEQRPA